MNKFSLFTSALALSINTSFAEAHQASGTHNADLCSALEDSMLQNEEARKRDLDNAKLFEESDPGTAKRHLNSAQGWSALNGKAQEKYDRECGASTGPMFLS